MPSLLPPWPQLSAFLMAVFILAASPGPAVLYIITRSLSGGWRQGALTVVGTTAGNLLACQLACAGVAALFTRWPGALTGVKLAGAAYLLFLGLQTLLSRPAATRAAALEPRSTRRLLIDGFFVALLNPKTYIFFAAFLPKFISPGAGYAQLAILGVVGPSFAAFTDLGYALAAGVLGQRMVGGVGDLAWTKWVSGAVFMGLGVWALAMR